MIQSIEIKGLRGIREGILNDLKRLVVLVGPNGSGKSTILDALFICANPQPPEAIGQAVFRRDEFRRGSTKDVNQTTVYPRLPRWLIWKGGNEEPASIKIAMESLATRICKLSVQSYNAEYTRIEGLVTDADADGSPTSIKITALFRFDGYERSGFSQPLADVPEVRLLDPDTGSLRTPLHQLYTRVVEQGLHKDAIATVAKLIPGVEDIRILTEGDSPVVHLIFRDRSVPAALAGDGIRLLLHLSFELATRTGGLALMEEPEVHMHPGAIRQCARAIVAAMRAGTQIVLTTHSLELIDALLAECSAEDLTHVSLYRCQLEGGVLKSSRLPGAEVAFARSQIQDDLR